ncbi:MAG: fructosamine kinase family protein [Balneolaceae bacterium]|nr:fructosamine kinase family protein [Balneolaceae bacterium]
MIRIFNNAIHITSPFMIPDSILHHLKTTAGITVRHSQPAGGGSINRASMLDTNKGKYFIKWNQDVPTDFFQKEAEGLQTLRVADHPLRIPDVHSVLDPSQDSPGYLLMEYIEENPNGDSRRFGAELAKLHSNHSEKFGFHSDNYIGSLPQSNNQHENWNDFFIIERLEPQLTLAIISGKVNSSVKQNLNRLAARLDDLIPPCKPSLLHGDLWGGNYLFDMDGNAVLIDPAVYYGHPEVDLAFSTMFGGFTYDFYQGYESVTPLEPGFDEREPIFNLYPLLVHVNLFGGHYIHQFNSIIQKF